MLNSEFVDLDFLVENDQGLASLKRRRKKPDGSL